MAARVNKKWQSFSLSIFLFLLGSPLSILNAAAPTEPYDHSGFQKILTQFVNEKGEVDYQGIKKDPALLESYLAKVAKLNLQEVRREWPREERMALFINLYHAGVMNAVRKHYPVREMNDIPNVWEETSVKMGLRGLSLNQIRQHELIAVFHDGKIDLALSCGARSCPKLSREVFTGPRVEGQLFLAARSFVNDPTLNKIIPGKRKIEISRLFKWYAADFNLDFGVFENDKGLAPQDYAVLSFLAYYLEDADQVATLEENKIKIRYLPFDWSLNEWVKKP